MALFLSDENFEKEVYGAQKPVLVDFWMQGCHPCFILEPVIEKLAEEFSEKLIFAKVNLDSSPFTAQKYSVNAAPTVILFKGGRPVSGFVGLRPEEEIKSWLEENLKS